MRKSIIGTLLAMGLLWLAGCANQEEIIPNVSFNASVYLADPAFTTNPFVVKYDVSRQRIGVYGVVIYRLSPTEYYVFDLMCPYDKRNSCLVGVEDGASCRCPCCQSLFIVATPDGGIAEGPSKWPLKTYNCMVTGDYLKIWN